MAKLTISERGRDRIYEICEDVVAVGAAPDCNVILRDPSASKLHCQIRKTKDGYRIVDLETKSGTRVNGEFMNQAALESGDRVQVGGTVIVFEDTGKIRHDVPPLGRRARRMAAMKQGLPPNAIGGLVVAGIAVIILVLVIGFRNSANEKPDETFYKQAMTLYDQGRFEDALAKLREIDAIPAVDRTPWVDSAKPEKEHDILFMIRSAATMQVKKESEREILEIDTFASAVPVDVDEIHRKLDAWLAKYRTIFSEIPTLVEKYNSLRMRFPRSAKAGDTSKH